MLIIRRVFFALIAMASLSVLARRRKGPPGSIGKRRYDPGDEVHIPWIADLGRMPLRPWRPWRHRCTGSLVDHIRSAHAGVVITSVGCADEIRATKKPEAIFKGGERIRIKDVFTFGSLKNEDEIGVLVLDKAAARRGVSLPKRAGWPAVKDDIWTAGWRYRKRRDYIFYATPVSILLPKLCKLRGSNASTWKGPSVCVDGTANVDIPCRGGCPLYTNTEDGYTLLGVYAYHNQINKRDIYFNVHHHLTKLRKWIRDARKKAGFGGVQLQELLEKDKER